MINIIPDWLQDAIDLIDAMPNYSLNLDWIRDEVISIRTDIDNS